MTALHYACKYHSNGSVNILLNHPDVDLNATDHFNDTPLHMAVRFGSSNSALHDAPEMQLSVIKNLLFHPFIIINQKNNDKESPFDSIIAYLNKLLNRYREHDDSESDRNHIKSLKKNGSSITRIYIPTTMASMLLSLQEYHERTGFVIIFVLLLFKTYFLNEWTSKIIYK